MWGVRLHVCMYVGICKCNSDNSLLVQELEKQLDDCVKNVEDLQDKTDTLELNA